jgi:tripartite-type tricarboxylate transporter receptor subunit TctC
MRIIQMQIAARTVKVALASLVCVLAVTAGAQNVVSDFPNRPVRAIVCFPVGSAPDIVARNLGERLNRQWKQGMIVDNRVGADCMIASDAAAKAPADGYTLYVATMGALALNPSTVERMPYDPHSAFAGVSFIAENPFAVLLRDSVAAKTPNDLVELGRTRAGGLNFGSAGSFGPLVGSVFRKTTGAAMTYVPYKGVQPALVDLMGGQIDMVIGDLPSLVSTHRQGKGRLLVVTSSRRSALVPEIPTMAEAGYKDFDFSTWYAVVVPGATPRVLIEKISADVVTALQAPELKQQLLTLGLVAQPSRPEIVDGLIKTDIAKWAALVKANK